MKLLRRKVDDYLDNWWADRARLPLIIRGARQIGKTVAVRKLAQKYYQYLVEINFVEQPQYTRIFDDGFEPEKIIKNISLINPELRFVPGQTLIFFDELQAYPNAATSLKFFAQEGKYTVICSGSLMGLNYQRIESNSVGYKQDYWMYPLDFEEFLWARGYRPEQLEDVYQRMRRVEPLTTTQLEVLSGHFDDYLVLGGMPAIVATFVEQGNFSGVLRQQKQLLLDYEEDVTKYTQGLDQAKVLSVYRKLPVFLGQDNKKFQISKIASGARNRNYIGVVDWLVNTGVVNICYCLDQLALPLRGNFDPNSYKLYFGDTGLLIGSLDNEAQADLRERRNFNLYKGAIYENVVAQMLTVGNHPLYFYRNPKSTMEIDFVMRTGGQLVPIEVKATDSVCRSLRSLVTSQKYPEIRYGVKLARKNIGYNGVFYTFPYFVTCWLRRWLQDKANGCTCECGKM